MSFFDTHSTSEINSAIDGCHALNNMMSWNVPYMLAAFGKLIMCTFYMLSLDFWFALLAIAVTIVRNYFFAVTF